jgi:tetratricopeptide (TPR) repeat protein
MRFICLSALIFSLGAAVVCAEDSAGAPAAVRAMEEGFRLYLDKKYQEAMDQYRTALIINPSYRIVWEKIGLVEMERKNYVAARTNFRKLAILEPDNPVVVERIAETYEYNTRGERFGKGFDSTACLSNYQLAIAIGRDNAQKAYQQGRLEFEKGDYRKASRLLVQAVRQSRDFAEAYWYLARCYESLSETERAYLYYRYAEILGHECPWYAECRKKVRILRRAL